MIEWQYELGPTVDTTTRATGVKITINKNKKRGPLQRVIRIRMAADVMEATGWIKGHGFRLKFSADLKHCLIYPHSDGFKLCHGSKSSERLSSKVLMIRPEALPQDLNDFFMSIGDHGSFNPEWALTDEGLVLTFD
jgi:hypothetical protein